MEGMLATLKNKVGGLPIGVWAVIFTAGLTLILMRNRSKSADSAAAGQTNTNLGTASSLADLFTVAGIMPYSGGDVYITQTVNQPGSQPAKPGYKTKPGWGPWIVNRPVVKPPKTNRRLPPLAVTSTPPKIVTVHKGDTLTSLARRFGLTANQLYAYNTGSGAQGANRKPSTIQTLKKRGPDLIYGGEKIYIPRKGTVYTGGY